MNDFIAGYLIKSVDDKTVFRDISFIIHDSNRIGIIGVNGTGKTTLLDVIPDRLGFSGDISPFSAKDGYKIAYLIQESEFDDDKTILDAVLSSDLREMTLIKIYETLMADCSEANQARLERVMTEMDSLDAWAIESEVKTVLTKLGLNDLSQKVGALSGGLRHRAQLAQVLLSDTDLLLLDEPTNHLDTDTIVWLTNFLKNSKKAVFFITHGHYFLDNVATRIFELANSQLAEYQGSYQDYVRLHAEQDKRNAATLRKKEQLCEQELAWMRTQPQARATRQQARINRFNELRADLSGTTQSAELEINFETSRVGKKVINFGNVSFTYPDKQILTDFNLLVQNKDRIGTVGDSDVGKSTLPNLINGDLQPTTGNLGIGEMVRIDYFSQLTKDMDENKCVVNYLQEVADEIKTSVRTTSVTGLLEQSLFPRSTHDTLTSELSGGERKRLYSLRILTRKLNVLLLDEPTNDLDIATLTTLESFLQTFPGPVIAISHDRYFPDKVANKISAFENGRVREFFGNYTNYLNEKAFEENAVMEQARKAPSQKTEEEKTKGKRMSYFEKQGWGVIEDEIAKLEEGVETIEAQMQEGVGDYGKLAELQRSLDEANETLLEKHERHDYLSDLAE